MWLENDMFHVEHDWHLTPLRREFLDSKRDLYWRPLLDELRNRGWLPENWQRVMRLAIFCCPTLVLDLRDGGGSGHTAHSSALGLAIAIMCGSTPVAGNDVLSDFFAALA